MGNGAQLFDLLGWETGQTFTLLYRASLHGFAASKFQSICHQRGQTLTIIKSSNGYIFGGYAQLPWDASGTGNYGNDSNAFIFTLTNPRNTTFVVRVATPAYALEYYSTEGPTFGGPGSSDIYISDQSNSNQNSHTNFGCAYTFIYACGTTNAQQYLTGNYNFQTIEIETYQSNVRMLGDGKVPMSTQSPLQSPSSSTFSSQSPLNVILSKINYL